MMATPTFLSRFTPSTMAPEALEAIFVQRQDLARRVIELIRDSAFTAAKHHTLLIGPRGIGKTHFISLVYYRLRAMLDLRDRLLIAWLREEEWRVASFLDFLMAILQALHQERPDTVLAERIEALYTLPADDAERAAAALLRDYVGERTLLLLMENLDQIFEGLGDEGQKQWRSYLQENPFSTILATSQSLFNGVSLQTSPFYGFFRHRHLQGLKSDEATELLAKIATLRQDEELAAFIQTPTGRGRIRAVAHLAGNNPRIYVIFSQFLTYGSLDELVEPVMHTLDDLTPYYQARMTFLSPQQRKIVDLLCDCHHAVSVSEIAQRCFITSQTASSQLGKLGDMQYVHAIRVGRESYYEIHEPLMRLCAEVKKQRGAPIRLFVEFLRLWYSRTELRQRLETLRPDASIERGYILEALKAVQEVEERLPHNDYASVPRSSGQQSDGDVLASSDRAIVLDPTDASTWINRGIALGNLRREEESLASFDRAIALDPSSAIAWSKRGVALERLGRHEEALASYGHAIALDPTDASAWGNQAVSLRRLGRHEEALASYDRSIALDPTKESTWYNRGVALGHLGCYEEALASYNHAIALDPTDASAWINRGNALGNQGQHEEALGSFDRAIALDPTDASAWYNWGVALGHLGRYEEARASFDRAVELDPTNMSSWYNRGIVLEMLERHEDALASIDQAINLEPTNESAWYNRGIALRKLDRYEEALESYDRAIGNGIQDPSVYFERLECQVVLGLWDDAFVTLDDALHRVGASSERHSSALSVTLFTLGCLIADDPAHWPSRTEALLQIYASDNALLILGPALVATITALTAPTTSHATALEWLRVWSDLAGNQAEMDLPLRLLGAAVQYHISGDVRALLELSVEERSIIQSLLKVELPPTRAD